MSRRRDRSRVSGGRSSVGFGHFVGEDVPARLTESRHEADPSALTHAVIGRPAALAYELVTIAYRPHVLECERIRPGPSRSRFGLIWRSRRHPPQPTTLPSSHPVRRRPTHRGAGVVHGVQVERATVRTTWTPWAASARLCLGRRCTGWEHPAHATTDPQSEAAPPHPGAGRSPRRRHGLDRGPRYAVIDPCPRPIHVWARVGAARAERAGGRSVARSGAGKRARRSGAQPGLDEVEKLVTTAAAGVIKGAMC